MSLRRLTEEEADKGGSRSAKGSYEACFFSLRGSLGTRGLVEDGWMAAMGSSASYECSLIAIFPLLSFLFLFQYFDNLNEHLMIRIISITPNSRCFRDVTHDIRDIHLISFSVEQKFQDPFSASLLTPYPRFSLVPIANRLEEASEKDGDEDRGMENAESSARLCCLLHLITFANCRMIAPRLKFQ